MRKPLVVGNWKMHGSQVSVASLLEALCNTGSTAGDSTGGTAAVEIAVCPAYLHIAQAIQISSGSAVAVGAQDCSHAESGAYTGEIAAQMLADAGCRWVILGHSERRQYHGESDQLVAKKLAAVVTAELSPILCVGETRQEREAGQAQRIVESQLRGALRSQVGLETLVVAYEPVWAIGTGLTASPDQAQEMHAFIRTQLEDIEGVDAQATRILYGGSVKPDNAGQLFAKADIDGALVGGASLVAQDFLAIAHAAAN